MHGRRGLMPRRRPSVANRESAANKSARRSAGHKAEPNALAKKRASASTWRPPDGRAFTLEPAPPQAAHVRYDRDELDPV